MKTYFGRLYLNFCVEKINFDHIVISQMLTSGVMVYQLLYGNFPFFALSLQELFHKIRKKHGDNLKFDDSIPVSDLMKKLVRSLLQMDPKKRISWDEFFNHKIFDEEDIKNKKKFSKKSESKNSFGRGSRGKKSFSGLSGENKRGTSTSLERKFKSSQRKIMNF